MASLHVVPVILLLPSTVLFSDQSVMRDYCRYDTWNNYIEHLYLIFHAVTRYKWKCFHVKVSARIVRWLIFQTKTCLWKPQVAKKNLKFHVHVTCRYQYLGLRLIWFCFHGIACSESCVLTGSPALWGLVTWRKVQLLSRVKSYRSTRCVSVWKLYINVQINLVYPTYLPLPPVLLLLLIPPSFLSLSVIPQRVFQIYENWLCVSLSRCSCLAARSASLVI